MKYVIFFWFFLSINSCRNCVPLTPFENQKAKDWVNPILAKNDTFITLKDTQKLILSSVFSIGKECVGGDECCSDFPITLLKYQFNSPIKDELFAMKSVGNNVEFVKSSGDAFSFIDVKLDTLINWKLSEVSIILSKTIINNKNFDKLIINYVNSNFKNIVFIKDIGITSFEYYGNIWMKK
jgi:hypothetical protein